jgi:predicted membrane channel-forming protein YqfA (hemolysin III family)
METKLWDFMYIGAGLCLAACIFLVYIIITSRDTRYEWTIYLFIIGGFALIAVGFIYESRYKSEHPEERVSKFKDIVEG